MVAQRADLTPFRGMKYYYPPDGAELVYKDGHARLPYGGIPMPLLDEDYEALEGEPSYDAIGRGIYQALRANPDCSFCECYATMLRDAYPHYLAELASNAIMLDGKEVEVPYLDRKIACLKILALLEPENAGLPLEIGKIFLDRGLRLSALHLSTVSLYRAEHFLRRAVSLAPTESNARQLLGEVCYLLGKYDDAANLWRDIVAESDAPQGGPLGERLARIEGGRLPVIPTVDYLEAVGVAFSHFQAGDFEESAAILQDVMQDAVFCEEFPVAEIHSVMGKCFAELGMPKYAEEEFREALKIDPGHEESRTRLAHLTE
ncbi:tetratricopeptide repeat protein [Geobacter pickeringii]|uniref:Tetratricopeptide repeat protein n=1 Tax=Geobacter pickeringii TaxID=345632 RepID=A0A0B5BAA0_9BACT|nr:tetratricopeptide repeat protein [Geobacter pickeringii]AJE03638.1 hypothetical protein GPICK_09995 [Geobacter pickeringii]